MASSARPLFRKRPPARGIGYDANGVPGWLFTVGFMVVFGATFGTASLLAVGSDWPLSLPLGAASFLQLAAFIWIAKRESDRL
jgi:hypothetical protein